MTRETIEKIYAGWLAKIIGIRLGAPVEGWTYRKIRDLFGEIDHYPVDYRDFAADDDSNVPLFFLRALEDGRSGAGKQPAGNGLNAADTQPAGPGWCGADLQAQDVAEALLNYAPFEHGFFWWGGYGISTEHTAYLNLRSGIPAPRSGSIAQNGAATAEQIGGQIFIDTWGLVTPGNPDLAARLASKAASVTHDGNGIYGGIFVAACISHAFVEADIRKILEKGLSYIPADSEYSRVVRAVMDFHAAHAGDAIRRNEPLGPLDRTGWRDCFDFIFENFGYDRYPGNCHIIPNIAVMILALLYGGGDFGDTLNICNLCGWDTDCNVGNVATLMGVRNGLAGIDPVKWRRPVNDFLVCSSVVGSMNIMDIPYGALYIAKLAARLAGEALPEPFAEIAENRIDSCHFELPGSTHAIRVRSDSGLEGAHQRLECECLNSDETAHTGTRSLKIVAKPVFPAQRLLVFKKTYYVPSDFHDSRYDPSFSPLVCPGQTVSGSAFLPHYGEACDVSLYVRDSRTGQIHEGHRVSMEPGVWHEMRYRIPPMQGALLDEMGFVFRVRGLSMRQPEFAGFIDDLHAEGRPDYSIEFEREREEVWHGLHREISQFTKLKGLMYLDGGALHLSCSDFAEAYTGHHDWTDVRAAFELTPVTGAHHLALTRVQGAMRSYAAGLMPDGRFAILKNDGGYRTVVETALAWTPGVPWRIVLETAGCRLTARAERVDGQGPAAALEWTDGSRPHLRGSIGIGVMQGSHVRVDRIRVD